MQWWKEPNEKLIRAAAIGVLLAVAAGMVWGVNKMRDLNTHYSMAQFMPKEHPLFTSDRLVKKTFRINDREPVIVNLLLEEPAKGTWLRTDRIEILRHAGEQLSSVTHIERVLSVANVEMATNTEQGIQVDRLLGLTPEAQWKKRVLGDPLLTPGLISKDGRKVTLIADIPLLSETEMKEMMAGVEEKLGPVARAAGAKLMVSGVLPLQTRMTSLLSQELVNFFGLAFLVCLVTLLAYFRSFSTVIVALILVIIANISTFTCLAVLGIPFSVLSSALPIICSIEALAIGSHTLLIFGDNYRLAMAQPHPPSKARIVWNSYRSLLFPNFLMSTTTIIGFATLISSQVPLIRQFSQSVSAGVLLSCVFMSIALPSLMYLFPIPVPRSWTGAKARWALWVIQNRRTVVFGVLGVATLFLLNGLRLNWAVQLYDDLPHVADIKTSADLIDKELGGMIPLEVMIRKEGEENPWYEPARMNRLVRILGKWRRDPAVGSAIGLPDLLNTGIQTLDSRQAIAETVFLYGFSGAENPTTRFLSTDGNATRLSFRMKDVNADQMAAMTTRLVSDLKKAFPGAEVHLGGMAAMVHPLNAELSADLIYGLWHSLLIITVLLVLVFRSFRLAFVAAVPNLLPPFALLAMMTYLKTPIKPVVAIIFSIALGLAYNNTVFLLMRLRKVQQSFKSAREVIMRTWYQEGNPCLFSSLAVIGGFAVFLASYFSPNRTFGAYMLWSIVIGLIGDLILLPALLRMFPWIVFPGEESRPDTGGSAIAARRPWMRNFLVFLTLLMGLGPTAAAAVTTNVVHTPFALVMKKEAFSQLIFDGIVADATTGSASEQQPDIFLSSPFQVSVTGIRISTRYRFNTPSNTPRPGEMNLESRQISAEITVDRVEAHDERRIQQGENTIVIRLDGVCTNVKFVLPEGSASASGRLVLGSQGGGSPRMELRDFKASWVPGSWQAVSMNCTGPSGFDRLVAAAVQERLRQIDPYLEKIRDNIQKTIDEKMSDASQRDIKAGNPFQRGQTVRFKNFQTRLNEQGDVFVRGDAYFYYSANRAGCGADIKDFSQAPALRPGDTAFLFPFAAIKALLACSHADGTLSFDTTSDQVEGFSDLMHSRLKKNAVWEDLNSFDEDSVMKFHGTTAEVPVLSGERAAGPNSFTIQIRQKLGLMMYAPKDGRYVPYTSIAAYYSGPVKVVVRAGQIQMKPHGEGQLALNGSFVKSYVDRYHPRGEIDWERLTPPIRESIAKQGWQSMKLPLMGVSTKVFLQPVDGDLQGSNFRLGMQIIRK